MLSSQVKDEHLFGAASVPAPDCEARPRPFSGRAYVGATPERVYECARKGSPAGVFHLIKVGDVGALLTDAPRDHGPAISRLDSLGLRWERRGALDPHRPEVGSQFPDAPFNSLSMRGSRATGYIGAIEQLARLISRI
jgi:hypothetical protein